MGNMARVRTAVLLVGFALFAAACGTMLDEDERRAAIMLQGGGGGGGGGGAFEDGELAFDDFDEGDEWDDDFGDLDGGTAQEPGTGGEDGTSGGEGGPAGGGATGGDGTGGGGGAADDGGATSGGGGGGEGGGTQDSGPRTASDVGVTPDEIVIANISDISGPIPGLFESARQATQAYAAYQNARGGIHGRQLRVLPMDSRSDASENRNATIQACERAFAIVGSMSAFDMGGAAIVDECGIPDVSAILVNEPRQRAQNSFPAYPEDTKTVLAAPPRHIQQTNPEVTKRAAILWGDVAATRINGEATKAALEKLGYEFVYTAAVSPVESNYAPFVLEMRRRDVQYVTHMMSTQMAARLAQTMDEQGYRPEVIHYSAQDYDPDFLRLAGPSAEGIRLFVNIALFEEIQGNEEMQRYVQWLRRVSPNAQPGFFGAYAWSATALFAQVAEQVGPDLTREKLLQALAQVEEWDGRGLHAPHRISEKRAGGCVIHVAIKDGRFTREAPSSGYDCKELIDV